MSKKIGLLVDSLSSGGAEKVAANMSIALCNMGYNITIVAMTNFIDYNFKGELYNFGLVKKKHSKLTAFFILKRYFKENKFDYIIDHRTRTVFFKELLLSKYIFKKCSIIYCIHSYNLLLSFSFLKIPWLAIFPHVKKKRFVSVSEEICKKLKQKLKLESTVIYNYASFQNLKNENKIIDNLNTPFIIGVGRLTKIKQFDVLIKSYNNSRLKNKGIKLLILGEGIEKDNLNKLIKDLNLTDFVELLGFKNKVYSYIEKAKALVLTSKVEGFPMVLIEALTLNTPIVAFNCKSGPNEIIKNGVNGLLVENQNEQQLTLALNKLLLNKEYYNTIKSNTSCGLDKFSEKHIIQQWIHIFNTQE